MADSPRIEELKRRVQSDPASIAFASLAEEYRRAGRYEEAIDTCRHGLERHPSYISAHVTLGRALLEVGAYDEARDELELVLRVAPENLAAIRGLAEIHHRRGQSTEAAAFSAAEIVELNAPAPSRVSHETAPREEPEAHRIEMPPAPASIPVVTQSFTAPAADPPADPALARLEAFLGAILRARKSGHSIHHS